MDCEKRSVVGAVVKWRDQTIITKEKTFFNKYTDTNSSCATKSRKQPPPNQKPRTYLLKPLVTGHFASWSI